jgi:ankyrin repeat protein
VGGEDEGELEHEDESTTATPLWTQVLLGDLAAVERLLQARACPDAVPSGDKDGNTPLLCAFKEGHTDIVRLLLKYKANANAQNNVCACSRVLYKALLRRYYTYIYIFRRYYIKALLYTPLSSGAIILRRYYIHNYIWTQLYIYTLLYIS